jgi:hypothetical protein
MMFGYSEVFVELFKQQARFMNDTRVAPAATWHLWLVGVLALLWNAAACFSHVQTLRQDEGYFRATGVTTEMAAYFAGVPTWYVVAWTVGVWGGLLASVGLLMRKSSAVRWFAASQLAMVVNSVWTLLNPNAYEVLGDVGRFGAIATIILAAFLVFYSMVLKRRGILR